MRACKLLQDGSCLKLVPPSYTKQANNIPDVQATGNLRRANLCASLKQLKFFTHPAFLRLELHKSVEVVFEIVAANHRFDGL